MAFLITFGVLSLLLMAERSLAGNNLVVLGGVDDSYVDFASVEIIGSTQVCSGIISDMPLAGHGLVAGYLADVEQLVVCGGIFEQSDPVRRECFLYDFATDTWTNTTGLGDARVFSAGAVVGDKFVVVGGGGNRAVLNSTEVYEAPAASWRFVDDYPNQVDASCGVGSSDKLIVTGGNTFGPANTVNAWDLATELWSSLPSMLFPRLDHACMSHTLNGRDGILVAGGLGESGSSNVVEFFDLANLTWQVLDPGLPVYSYGLRMGDVQGVPTIVGGFFNSHTMQWIDGQWVEMPDLDPLNKRNWAALVAVPDNLAVCQ